MSERLKGLTIELSLDSMKVDSGLKDLRSSMRQMNSEMRSNMSQFGRSEKSLKKYGTQLDGLKKKYELQSKVVDSARDKHEKLQNSTTASTKEIEKAATEYNNASAQLNNLGRYIDGVAEEMNAFSRQQDIQATKTWRAGDAMQSFGDNLRGVSQRAVDLGSDLTRRITLPVVGVTTAVGGMVAAFGWKRLVGLDSAQAQLKGLGYSTKEVGRISDQVTSAIDGGMTTMAEGTMIAAGALASGVKEGAELEKYIKLVGDAAVGANRPVEEMAQIFNRVQGGGRLMTQELNQIEHGMPGFSQAMAKHLGVGVEEFRKMVTAGKVSSKDFLTVMDDFAGGMASAYSESWAGMVANTKAYIGIIGENLLSGVFEQSKESIGEFIELLKSDEAVEWAKKTGESLGSAFTSIVEGVKDTVKWFTDLEGWQKKLVVSTGIFVVALGPMLVAIGKIGLGVSALSTGFGTLLKWIAPLITPIKTVATGISGTATAATAGAGKVGLLSRAFTVLGGPVGWTIGIVSAVAGMFTLAYKRSEPLRNSVENLKDSFGRVYNRIKDLFNPMGILNNEFGALKDGANFLWNELKRVAGIITDVLAVAFDFLVKKVNFVIEVFEAMLSGFEDFVEGWKRIFAGDFTGAIESFSSGVSTIFTNLKGVIANTFGDIYESIKSSISGWVSSFAEGTANISKTAWDWTKDLATNIKDGFVGMSISIGESVVGWKDAIMTKLLEITSDAYDWALELPGKIKKGLINAKDNFVSWFVEKKDDVSEKTTDITTSVTSWAKELPGKIKNALGSGVDVFNEFIEDQREQNKEFYGGLGEKVKDWLVSKKEAISEGLESWSEKFTDFFYEKPKEIKKSASDMWNSFSDGFLDKKEAISEKLEGWSKSFTDFFYEMPKKIKEKSFEMWQTFKENFLDKKDAIKEGFVNWKDGISEWFTKTKNSVRDGAENFGENFKTGLVSKKDAVIEGLNTWWTSMKDWFSNLGKKQEVKNSGKEMTKSIGDGFKEGKGDLLEKVAEVIVDIPKYILIVGAVLFFAVGRELLKRTSEGFTSMKETLQKVISNLWEGLKKIFDGKGAEIVKSLKTSFIGRVISNVIEFSKNFKSRISEMWQSVKNKFAEKISEIYSSIKNSFVGRIITSIAGFATGFRKRISDMWNSLKNTFTSYIESIRKSIANSFVGRMLESVTNLKDNFIRLASDMWKGVKKQFTNIVDGAKALPGRIGTGIKNAQSKAVNGMKSVGNAIIRAAGRPFNGVIGGVNWIIKKFDKNATGIPKWDYPQYAKGTDGHPGGPAILGDGKGSNAGSELVTLPNGKNFLSADKPTLYPNLPRGTEVLPANLTKQVPMYAKGVFGKVWGGVKALGSSISNTVKDIWSYATNPSKLVNEVMSKIGVIKDKAQIPTKMVTAGFNNLKNKPVDYVKGLFKKHEETGGGPAGPAGPTGPAGTGAKRWRNTIKMASARMNANATEREINGIIAQIHRESGGNQRIVQSNAVWDVNTAAGNPARGLLQYIPQTFNAYKTRGHGNIYNGYHQLRAFFNNSTWRRDLPYGRRGWGPRGARRGYETGGLIQSEHMAMLGEDGPEMVIPLNKNRRTDAMKLLALTGRMLGADNGKSKRPNSLPNVKGGNESNALLDAVLKQNEILMQLLQKDNTAVIGFEEVYQPVKKRLDEDRYRSNKRGRRYA